MLAAPLDALLPAIQQRCENFFDPLGVEKSFFDVADHDAVELVHGNRPALAAGFALPRPDRAGIIAVGHTLVPALEQVVILTDQVLDLAVVDRGYRGYGVNSTKILISGM